MSSVAHFSLAQYELMVISAKHAWAVDRLNAWSFRNTDPADAIVRIQSPTRIPKLESEPEPDVLWLVNKDYSSSHPEPEDVLLLIEVAESSLAYDTGEKARLYAEAGIADYWVIDLAEDCVEVFRDPQPTGYRSRQTYRGDEEVRPLAFPDVSLQPSALFRPS